MARGRKKEIKEQDQDYKVMSEDITGKKRKREDMLEVIDIKMKKWRKLNKKSDRRVLEIVRRFRDCIDLFENDSSILKKCNDFWTKYFPEVDPILY